MATASTDTFKIPTIEEVLNPPENVMAELMKDEAHMRLLELLREYYAK